MGNYRECGCNAGGMCGCRLDADGVMWKDGKPDGSIWTQAAIAKRDLAAAEAERDALRQEMERLKALCAAQREHLGNRNRAEAVHTERIATLEAALRRATPILTVLLEDDGRYTNSENTAKVLSAIDTALGAQQGKGEP